MIEITKEARLLQTFAGLADTLVDGYDIVDLLQRLVDSCSELLDTTAAAILLADQSGELDVMASTSDSGKRCRITRAGLPATIAYGGTFLVTTLPAPTMAPSPIVTPSLTNT